MNTSRTNINRSKPLGKCLFGGGYIPNSWAVFLVCRHRYAVFGTTRQKNYSCCFSPTGANLHMRSRGDTIRSGDGYIGNEMEICARRQVPNHPPTSGPCSLCFPAAPSLTAIVG